MKNIHLNILIAVSTAFLIFTSCASPDAGKKDKGETIQDTSMPGQQNDGFPYNNPNSRRDNIVRDSATQRDSIIGN